MKIGLISDTHGNLWGWERAWELVLHDADVIVHCGDLLYHGPKFRPPINAVEQPLLIVKGNGDSEVDQLVIDAPIQTPYLFAQIEGTRMLATHGHLMPQDELEALCAKWGVGVLLTGHTHVPSITWHGAWVHINPGTPTYPLDPDKSKRRPTCGAIEDGDPYLIDLGTGQQI